MSASPLTSRRQLARTISSVEDRNSGYTDHLVAAYQQVDWARVIGVTGPPGAGKSSLTDALASHWAQDGDPVAILAVDPSSPFSGGAILGDRIRMSRSTALPNVYMRSLASRGHLGGLSIAALDIIAILSQAGFRRIIVETVGAGQADIEILNAVDCVIVVAVPGLGDQIQAAKAGIMEIADVYVVNKSDLPGADTVKSQIDATLRLVYSGIPGLNVEPTGVSAPAAFKSNKGVQEVARRHGEPGGSAPFWCPPIVAATATRDAGVAEITDSVDAFLSWAQATQRLTARRTARIVSHLTDLLYERLVANALGGPAEAQGTLQSGAEAVQSGVASPVEIVTRILAQTSARACPDATTNRSATST